jgi:hypothetical protein
MIESATKIFEFTLLKELQKYYTWSDKVIDMLI